MTEAKKTIAGLPCCRALYLGALFGSFWSVFFIDEALSTRLGMALLSWALVFSFLAPGVFLVAALRPASTAPITVLAGCGTAWIAVSLLDILCKLILPDENSNTVFLIGWAAVGVSSLVLLHRKMPSVEHTKALGTLLLTGSILVAITALILSGSIYEADLNPDGYEMFMGTRSLQQSLTPSWPDLPNGMPFGFGMFSTALVARPFDAFFIEADATNFAGVRVAALFGVFCLLVAVAAFRRKPLTNSITSLTGPGLGILAVTLTIATSSGYDPLSCDLASPGTVDLIALGALMALIVGLWQGSWPLIIGFSALAILARPTPLLVIGIGGMACWLTKSLDKRACIRRFGAAFLTCVGVMVLYVAMSQGGGESSSVLSRLRFLTLTDISRLRFLAIPAGLVTALVLFIPTKLDREGRALLVTCWCTFAFFAVSSFISLHHFLLPMFLPIVIFWRSELCRSKSTAIAASLGSLIVVVALLMNNPTPNTQLTSLSQRVAFSSAPKERHHEALDMAAKLLTVEATTTYATTDGYRHALARIILHKAPASPSASTEFWVIDSDDPIPANWVMVARNDSHVLIEPRNRTIRSLRVQEVSYAHPLLFIPLEQQFRHLGEARGNFDIDLRTICPWQ